MDCRVKPGNDEYSSAKDSCSFQKIARLVLFPPLCAFRPPVAARAAAA
jgi:hypothetical protein